MCRAMRAYGMGYREVMSMPIRAFWTVSGFVERLHADEAKLSLEINAVSQDGEATQQLFERLQTQAPEPVKFTGEAIMQQGADMDEVGFASLKSSLLG